MICCEQLALTYYPGFFSKVVADGYFETLTTQLQWEIEHYKMFGKMVAAPRLLAWYGDTNIKYRYSGLDHIASEWTQALINIKIALETKLSHGFNSVLANFYRDGQDSMGWHADDENELGSNPMIASLSFGASRIFSLRTIERPRKSMKILLEHGSLLVMHGPTQHYWQHAILKTKKCLEPRINLTFRQVQVSN